MNRKIVLLSIWIFLVVLLVAFFQWRSANVVSVIEESKFNVGDSLGGEFFIENIDMSKVDSETKVLFLLSNPKGEILINEAYDLESLVSGGKVNFDMGEIEHIFENEGEYEADLVIFDIGYFGKKKIIVE
jgi:hypothetical protein